MDQDGDGCSERDFSYNGCEGGQNSGNLGKKGLVRVGREGHSKMVKTGFRNGRVFFFEKQKKR